ncbi:unnamed protein product [Lampetra planeri]
MANSPHALLPSPCDPGIATPLGGGARRLEVHKPAATQSANRDLVGLSATPSLEHQTMGNMQPTVEDFPDFDAEQDAKDLCKACRGIGTDEDEIIAIIANRSARQREEVERAYKSMYGNDLVDVLKGELRGELETVVVALMDRPCVYDAKLLRGAMRGIGTDESLLVEILCTRQNANINAIRMSYNEIFDRDLESDLSSETSGDLKNLLVALVQGDRDSGFDIDEDQAEEDARELHEAGEGKWGTDEFVFNAVLAKRNYMQLRATFCAYEILHGSDIEEVIKSEVSGILQEAYLTIIRCAKDAQAYFAEKIYRSMKGVGTDDDTLIRIIVSRAEVDLGTIREKFNDEYETPLGEWVDGECGGDYKKILLALLH